MPKIAAVPSEAQTDAAPAPTPLSSGRLAVPFALVFAGLAFRLSLVGPVSPFHSALTLLPAFGGITALLLLLGPMPMHRSPSDRDYDARMRRLRGFDRIAGLLALLWSMVLMFSGLPIEADLALPAAGFFMAAAALRNRPRYLSSAMLAACLSLAFSVAMGFLEWRASLSGFGLIALAWSFGDALRRGAADSLAELRELERRNEVLLELSIRDGLTGLLNRRALVELGHAQVAAAQRYGDELHALMFDIDHFKKVNDSLGHTVGDVVLKDLSAIGLSCLRLSDSLGRYGGEEFFAILPRTSLEDAYHIANRLRDAVAQHPFDRVPWRVTVSVGVAGLKPGDDFPRLIERVDSFLYMSKQAGRNRVSGA